MSTLIDTLLLLALPASGKSEVRRYLSTIPAPQCASDFFIGPPVQLDDFPYVHFMRRIDEVLAQLHHEPLFFQRQDRPFKDPLEWGTLIELLNEDYDELLTNTTAMPPAAAYYLFHRLEEARQRVGGPAKLSALASEVTEQLAQALEEEATALLHSKYAEFPDSLREKTVIIEFARGGDEQAHLPLSPPFGYQYALSLLSPAILSRAAILYIWVTPEESRRKNQERANPNDPGSILHHGVPEEVMRRDYGCDDLEYLLGQSDRPQTIKVEKQGQPYHLPVAFFDNRTDRTSFIRSDPQEWSAEQVATLHRGLQEAFAQLRP